MPEYDFLYVPTGRVLPLWPCLKPHIETALAHSAGEYIAEDLLDLALATQAQLWAALADGAVVGAACTQLIDYPRKRSLHVIALAGREFDGWAGRCVAESNAFARSQGCDFIRITGRRGWARRLRKYGYTERYRQVEKLLHR